MAYLAWGRSVVVKSQGRGMAGTRMVCLGSGAGSGDDSMGVVSDGGRDQSGLGGD